MTKRCDIKTVIKTLATFDGTRIKKLLRVRFITYVRIYRTVHLCLVSL